MEFISALKKNKKTNHLLLFSLAFLIIGSVVLIPLFSDENKKFEKIADQIFINELLGNTLNMHYTLAYPEKYGITEYTAVLPCYSPTDSSGSSLVIEDYLNALGKLNPEKLSEENCLALSLLSRSLSDTLAGQRFSYFDEPLSPSSGMQSQLPILLAEYTFRREQDIIDYLSLLDQTDEYFASLALYEAEKKAAGLLQADTSLKQVIEQCSTILTLDDLESNCHFLQTSFVTRMKPLIDNSLLSSEKADYYISLNDRLLCTVMQPAYAKLADDLFLLMGDGTSTPVGLATYPGGQEYYAHLVRESTGSSRTVDDIKKLLYPIFQEEYQTLQNLLQAHPEAIAAWANMRNDTTFPYTNARDILNDLTKRMERDFPSLPAAESAIFPSPTVKNVSENLAPYCAPAFYLTPPLDDSLNNVIYINPLSTTSGLELYTTLAHEGYPGHLYQSVYSNMVMQQANSHPIRQILWYGGYQEGWALYVEFISYDYAISLAHSQGKEDLAHAYEIEKHNRNMQLCLYSILDISIHYDNASYEDIHQILSAFGIKDPVTTKAVYDYIAEEPTNYLKYYLGYQEILSLKEKAVNLWQKDYSDYRFHQFFLDCGPSDFDTLESTLS